MASCHLFHLKRFTLQKYFKIVAIFLFLIFLHFDAFLLSSTLRILWLLSTSSLKVSLNKGIVFEFLLLSRDYQAAKNGHLYRNCYRNEANFFRLMKIIEIGLKNFKFNYCKQSPNILDMERAFIMASVAMCNTLHVSVEHQKEKLRYHGDKIWLQIFRSIAKRLTGSNSKECGSVFVSNIRALLDSEGPDIFHSWLKGTFSLCLDYMHCSF